MTIFRGTAWPRRVFIAAACLPSVGPSARAQQAEAEPGPLAQPAGRVILRISGQIGVRNVGEEAAFDRDMLEAVGTDGFATITPWYEGLSRFEGVPMARLMQRVGARGSVVRAVALNDFVADIPMADFARFGVLLALKRNGAYMPVSDKGPLFIVYPFSDQPQTRNLVYYGRSVWQVARLVVQP